MLYLSLAYIIKNKKMKKTTLLYIFNILFVLINPIETKSQNYPSAGQYLTNTTMQPFIGEWRWVDGTDTLQISLKVKKVFFDFNGGYYSDCLVGWHIFKRGQTVIENTYQYIDQIDKSFFIGGNKKGATLNKVKGTVKDRLKVKHGNLELVLDNSVSPNQITWKIKNSEGIKYRKSNEPAYNFSFTLPTDILLIKQ